MLPKKISDIMIIIDIETLCMNYETVHCDVYKTVCWKHIKTIAYKQQ